MKLTPAKGTRFPLLWNVAAVACLCLSMSVSSPAQETAGKPGTASSTAPANARGFSTPQQAAEVLIAAAEKFDEVALLQIFGPAGEDIVFSGEYAQDRQHAANFVAEAREKNSISVDPNGGNRAFLLVGDEDWPFPVPLEPHCRRYPPLPVKTCTRSLPVSVT